MTEAVRSHLNRVNSVVSRSGYQLSRGRLQAVLDESVDSRGELYAILEIIDATGLPTEAIASVRRFGDLELIVELEGSEVDLLRTPSGIEVLPPFYPHDRQEIMWPPESDNSPWPEQKRCRPSAAGSFGQSAVLRSVIGDVARVAKRQRMPTAVWVHMP